LPGERGEAGVQSLCSGAIEKDDRKAHLPVAAKETFKYAVIRKDKKDKIMQELEKLILKS